MSDLSEKAARVTWGRPGRRQAFAPFGRKGFTPDLVRLARKGEALRLRRDTRIAQASVGESRKRPSTGPS